MLLIRNIMYCKPGKVRPMVEKFMAMNELGAKVGRPHMRIFTDFAAERYWTVVAEMEVDSMEHYESSMSIENMSNEDKAEFSRIMSDYHDLVESGRREIYRIEG